MRYLLILLIPAILLKFLFFNSHPPGLYWDEFDTGYQAYSLLLTGRDYFGNLFPAHLQAFADYRSGLYMYLTVPWVKIFGLSAMPVRITAVIFSLITLFFIYYLSFTWLKLKKFSILPVMVAAFSPWTMIQGRIAAESMIMLPFMLLGMIGFFEFLRKGKYLWLSALGFSLSLWSYGTAKMFLPILFLVLLFVYLPVIGKLKLSFKFFVLPLVIFGLISFLPLYETFSKPIYRRFSEISVLTDPTTASEVNYRRLEAALGGGKSRQLGMVPSVLEKAVYNKLTYWSGKLISNYVNALSTNFLFLTGDPNLRHNLNLQNTGQFYLLEIIPYCLGLFVIFGSFSVSRNLRFLLFWLLLSPLPSIITRDGGSHAPRLLFLFPAMVFIISLGLKRLFKYKAVAALYLTVYLISVSLAVYYFFTTYRVTSAQSFNTGFSQAIELAIANRDKYDRIIIDTQKESALLPYLFVARVSPSYFQKSFPLPSEDLLPGVSGFKFGNILILYPGVRDWTKLKPYGNNLVISTADQPNIGKFPALSTILNPDSSISFSAFSIK